MALRRSPVRSRHAPPTFPSSDLPAAAEAVALGTSVLRRSIVVEIAAVAGVGDEDRAVGAAVVAVPEDVARTDVIVGVSVPVSDLLRVDPVAGPAGGHEFGVGADVPAEARVSLESAVGALGERDRHGAAYENVLRHADAARADGDESVGTAGGGRADGAADGEAAVDSQASRLAVVHHVADAHAVVPQPHLVQIVAPQRQIPALPET